MHGRSCLSLPVLSLLVLSPVSLDSQANPPERSASDRDSRSQFSSPGEVAFLPVEPNGAALRTHVAGLGTFGFNQLTRAAGTIFSGTVTAVACRPADRSQAIETVSVTFHVERAIRGAVPGEDLTISQWIGIWSSGQRYRVGERVLLFLYPPSKLGLTSSVGAGLGRFRLDPRGRVLLSAQHLIAFRTDPLLGGKTSIPFSDFARAVQEAELGRPGNEE